MGSLNFTLKCSTTFQLLRKILNTQKSQGICNYGILTKQFRRKAGHRGQSEVESRGSCRTWVWYSADPTEREQELPPKSKPIKPVLFTVHRTDSLKQGLRVQASFYREQE